MSGPVDEAGSFIAESLRPDEKVLWSGRPRTNLAPGDPEAAFVAAIIAFAVLGGGTALGIDAHARVVPLGIPLAVMGACVLGLALTISRVSAAGPVLSIALTSSAPILALALARGGLEQASALACQAGSLAFVLVWVALRFVEHRATRYHLTATRGFIEEPGRYVISFELDGEPVARPSRLARGRVGAIEVGARRGQLRTKKGLVIAVPAGTRRFVRVDYPGDVVKTWREGR